MDRASARPSCRAVPMQVSGDRKRIAIEQQENRNGAAVR
jgi:hypothetical protein